MLFKGGVILKGGKVLLHHNAAARLFRFGVLSHQVVVSCAQSCTVSVCTQMAWEKKEKEEREKSRAHYSLLSRSAGRFRRCFV